MQKNHSSEWFRMEVIINLPLPDRVILSVPSRVGCSVLRKVDDNLKFSEKVKEALFY